jgi:hypothetical protein
VEPVVESEFEGLEFNFVTNTYVVWSKSGQNIRVGFMIF